MSKLKNIGFTTFHPKVTEQLNQDVETLFQSIEMTASLKEACLYVMVGSGKRVRPLMVASSFASIAKISDVPSNIRRSMLAVELLHAYSLVHDDLPCMDDDDLRRGRATTHIAFGEARALLVGDALQSLAFEVLTAELNGFDSIDPVLSAKLLAIFAPRARRMVSGQMCDIEAENLCETQLTQNELQAIHADKTGALIEASVLMGALCAYSLEIEDSANTHKQKNNAMQMKMLEKFAKELGLAFQVQDDILDVTANTYQLGKPSGSDEKLNKSTYVKLMGIDSAKEYAKSLFYNGIVELNYFGDNNMLIQLANWLWLREH